MATVAATKGVTLASVSAQAPALAQVLASAPVPAPVPVVDDDGDDNWETKDESELLIDNRPAEPFKPPGGGGPVSLRPGGGAMEAFSSVRKAEPCSSTANGKKSYDKDFLLQFAKFCTERPSSLPDMEIVPTGPGGEPAGPVKGGTKGGPPGLTGLAGGAPGGGGGVEEWRRVDSSRSVNRGLGDGIRPGGRGQPAFNDPRAPGNNQYQKGPPVGKERGKGKEGVKSGALRGFSNFDVKPLEESDNAWKPATKSKEDVDALEKLLRTTKGLLNKFTPEKFEKLTDQFLELEITCRTDMIAIIDLVFDKALFEPIFGFMYSQLCVRCAEKFPEFVDENNPDAKPHTFKRLLLNKCQEEFEKENVVEEELAKLPDDTDPAHKEQIRKQAKNRMLGNIRFIGELYKCKMLTEKIMHECVIKLLGDVKNPDLDEVECLVKLLTAIGKLIDHPKSKEYMDAYFARIRDMSLHSSLPNRVRFMLQEVIELRRGAWKERKADPTLRSAPMPTPTAPPARGGTNNNERIQQGRGDVRQEMGGSQGRSVNNGGTSVSVRGGVSALAPARGDPGQQPHLAGQQQSLRSSDGVAGRLIGGPAPAAVPPALTKLQVEKELEDHLEEFFLVGDTSELVACLQEMVPRLPVGRTESLGLSLLRVALPKACDARTEGPRDRVCEMLAPLHTANLLVGHELQALFRDTLEFMEDEVVDVPHLPFYYARFLAHSVATSLVPLASIVSALDPLIDARLVKADVAVGGQAGAAFLLVEILRALAQLEGVGEAGAKHLYADANFEISALLPADDRSDAVAAALLAAAHLNFVDPELTAAVKRAEATASAEAASARLIALEEYLRSGVLIAVAEDGEYGESALEEAARWLDEHVGPLASASDDKVARVMMRCVLDASVEPAEPPSAPKMCKQIEHCAKLLKMCTQSSGDAKRIVKQAGCLYEVQAFCGSHEWPQGLMKKLFYNLYETDVVFEDAYGVWREDVNDQTPGKDKALFQVNEFLQWLDEAVEDDGEDS